MVTNSINDVGLKHIWDKIIALLSNKVNKETGKGLSTNDYTTSEKSKLAGIEAGAQVNTVNSDDISGSKTVTGNPLTITDGSETYAEELSVDLEPIQDLHGYDKPWVGGAGKNILPITMEDGITDGVTYTKIFDNSGNVIGIKCQGQISGQTARYLCSEQNVPAGLYRLTGGSDISSGGIRIVARYGSTYRDCTSASGNSFTLSEQTSVKFYVRGQTSGKDIDITIYPMLCLESATDPTLFEQYENISPITGYTEVDCLTNDGTLFDYKGYFKNYVVYSTSKVGRYPIKLKANTTYTCSTNIPYYGSDSSSAFAWSGNDVTHLIRSVNDGIGIYQGTLYSKTITSDSNGYITVGMYFESSTAIVASQSDFDRGIYWVKIEEGSIVTPYHANHITAQLGQTVYGATMDWANGVMIVDRGYADLGDLTWTYWNADNFYAVISDKRSETNTDVVLSCYPALYGQDKAAYCLIGNENQRKNIYIRDSSYSHDSAGATALKTALTGQQICYPLATPITVPLTPQQLKLLKGQNYITSNGTTIHLTYQPDNAVGDAVSEAEKYADRIIEGKQNRDVGNYSRNLVFQTIIGASINPSGKIVTNSVIDLQIAKVEQGTIYTATENRTPTNMFTYGFFTEIPEIGSTTYNESRYSDISPTFISPISGYAAFWTNTGYETPMLEYGSVQHPYEPHIPTNAELYEMIKALQNS